MQWKVLHVLLEGYDLEKKQYLVNGFRYGFHLHFEGKRVFQDSPNLKSADLNPTTVDQKIKKELDAGRIAGPFSGNPFQNIKISPLGIVPKKTPNEFRMIHHLSYPKGTGTSVNEGIPKHHATVSYARVDDAVHKLKRVGRGSFLAKTDIESAFRIIPIHPDDYELLGFKWKDEFYYDRCLPMGASSSCNIFEIFSTALEWLAVTKCKCGTIVHILDDFLFIGRNYHEAYFALQNFQKLCALIGIPLSQPKTFLPEQIMSFMGITLDSVRMEARLPDDKLDRARALLRHFQDKRSCTLQQLLSLIGFLNFACMVVTPGRTFLRRLINLSVGVPQLHYHIRISRDAQKDMALWLEFLEHFNGRSFFLWDQAISSTELQLFTDASAAFGYGAVYGNKWFLGAFPTSWKRVNITFLELYPIVLSVEIWGHLWQNHRIICITDNEALVAILNKKTSKVQSIMFLVRKLVLSCLRLNIEFRARHIPGKLNCKADALSRFQVSRFKALAPHSDKDPTKVPVHLLPKHFCKNLTIC